MEKTNTDFIDRINSRQKTFFRSGVTLDIKFRKDMLRKLLAAIDKWEKPMADALWTDLHKSYEEAYMTEISIVKGEIRNHIQMGKAQEGFKPPEAIPLTQLCREGTARQYSDHRSLELPCPAPSESSCRSYFGRMHCCAETIPLCADRFSGAGRHDI